MLAATSLSEPIRSPDGKYLASYASTNGTFDLWVAQMSYDAKTQQYRVQGNPTSGGVDPASHPLWVA